MVRGYFWSFLMSDHRSDLVSKLSYLLSGSVIAKEIENINQNILLKAKKTEEEGNMLTSGNKLFLQIYITTYNPLISVLPQPW
jgi:hypothetical protein